MPQSAGTFDRYRSEELLGNLINRRRGELELAIALAIDHLKAQAAKLPQLATKIDMTIRLHLAHAKLKNVTKHLWLVATSI